MNLTPAPPDVPARLPRAAARAALAAAPWLLAACSNGQAAPPPPDPAPPPVRVEVAAVRERPVPQLVTLPGSLRAARQTELAANASGRVVATPVERGDEVAPGAVLARLDTRAAALGAAEAAANARGARAQAEVAGADCARGEALLAKGALSRQDHERLAAQCRASDGALAAAEARAALAAKGVGDGLVRAPFAGAVVERFVNVGEFVREDSKVAALVALDPLRLAFTVGEAELGAVRAGQRVRFAVAAHPGAWFEGTVRAVGAAVREATRDVPVEADVPNGDRRLRPGMFARVELAAGEAAAAVVPRAAVVERDGEAHVFVVAAGAGGGGPGRAEERVVQLGAEAGPGEVAVARGLRAGERVVVGPPAGLRNGAAVE